MKTEKHCNPAKNLRIALLRKQNSPHTRQIVVCAGCLPYFSVALQLARLLFYPELCWELIELLLHIKIDHLEQPQSEKTVQESFDAKSVRFDVYTKDDRRIFDLEMQTTDTKNLPKRARYYQSAIDTDNLAKGENYTKLKDSYIIFICLDDIFGKELPVYSFENICFIRRMCRMEAA